jgi:osmoprotectant transport system ATP-binding protein
LRVQQPVGYGGRVKSVRSADAQERKLVAAGPGRTGGATVEFRHVTKRYNPGEKGPGAVNDLSFTVPAGKVCVLVGPSGCGKTTSLKMVNRLIEPTSGEILIDGRNVAHEKPTQLRRRIGYVIQQIGLFPHMTIGDNVAVVPRLLRWRAERIRDRVDELLVLVGLDPAKYRDRYPSQLSGGERQRVGVARALAADPPVMLMDEPFGAVDPIVRDRLQNEFLRLQRELAKTILFVTHDIDEAIKMGDLVAVMQVGGILAQFGPPEEILTKPASDFVARFVGADRGLKRLSLTRVGDLKLPMPVMAKPGERAQEGRQRLRNDAAFPYLLLVNDEQRPIGWISLERIPMGGTLEEAQAIPASPLLEPETTLKDALSMMLASDVQAGIAVSREGRVRGLLTLDRVGEFLRGETAGPGADGADGRSADSEGIAVGRAAETESR